MKKTASICRLLSATALVAILYGFCPSPTHTVTGYIDGLGNDSLIVVWADLYKTNYSASDVHDSMIAVHDGRFTFDLPIKGLTYIRFNPKSKFLDGNHDYKIELLMQLGEQADVTGKAHDNFIEYNVSGSPLSADYACINIARAQPMREYIAFKDTVMDEYRSLAKNQSVSEEKDARMEQIKRLVDEKAAWATYPVVEYIRDNSDSELSVLLLQDIPVDSVGKYYPLLSERVRDTSPGRIMNSLYERFLIREQYKHASGTSELKEGMQAPQFTLRTDKGGMFSLSQLKENGKYVLLDFWTYTCGPCRAEMPEIKKCVERFGDKIEFINIVSSTPESIWNSLIAEYSMDWLQLADSVDDPMVVKYNVRGFPTKVLLDPDHNVHKIFVGGGRQFFEEVEKLYDSLADK